MPDLLTHILTGAIVSKKYFIKLKYMFFLIGNILPDLASRIPMILFPKYIPFFEPCHTLSGSLVTSYLFVLFLSEDLRKIAFIFIFIGTLFHQFLDLFQKNLFNQGYELFFPLSYEIRIGLFWPEDSLYLIPFLLFIFLAIYLNNHNKILFGGK